MFAQAPRPHQGHVLTPRQRRAVPLGRWLRRGLWLGVLALVLYQLWILGHILYWRYQPLQSTAFMREQLEQLREAPAQPPGREPQLQYQWVEYAAISRPIKLAVIAAEDAKFVQHGGFDWDGLRHAYEKNRQRGRVVAGGSTITQQLAKNLFLSSRRSWVRKLEEAWITLLLEALLSKTRILTLYLNAAEFGQGIFGVEAAARSYFKIPAKQVSAAQAAHLAAMLTRPRFYQKAQKHPALARKKAIILRRMPASRIPD
jgi:monofunctional glycosyltransferase